MEIEKFSPEVSICGQITPPDMSLVHALGFKSVICNRPDGEDASQPLFNMIKAASDNAGLECRYLAVKDAQPTSQEIAAYQAALEDLPKPILAYCGTGARSRALVEAAG